MNLQQTFQSIKFDDFLTFPVYLNTVCLQSVSALLCPVISVVSQDLVQVRPLVVNQHGDDAADVILLLDRHPPRTVVDHAPAPAPHGDLHLGVAGGAHHGRTNL